MSDGAAAEEFAASAPRPCLSPSLCSLPVVLHFAECFVPVTENWIYQQVTHTTRYRPVVATEKRANPDQFPFEAVRFPETQSLAYRITAGTFLGNGKKRERCAVPLQALSRAYERPARAVQPAVMHAHFGTQAVHLLRLRQRLAVPLVTTFYGYDGSSIPQLPGWTSWYQRLFRVGDRFLVEGSAFRMRLIELGCPSSKVVVHHLGVDVDAIPHRPRRLASGEPIRLLMAASFREKKGHEYALRAFAAARRRLEESRSHARLELRLIGDGDLRPRIEAMIRDLGIGSSVRLLGAQPHAGFIQEALDAHLFLAPSVTAADGDTEGGAPVGLIEAAATGLPAIASRHADIPEVVRDGETGWLAPERNVEALTEHLVRLLEHPECWPAIGARARQHVEVNYNLSRQAQRLDDLYDEVREGAP